MAIIIPAILEHDKEAFADKVYTASRIRGVETIQVDFCDGQFVETASLPIRDIDPLNPAFTWEAHLMVKEPKDFLDYKMAGFATIVVHYEAFASEAMLEEALEAITALGLNPAVAVNPETSVSVLRYFTDTVKQFTILSVHPGKQGQNFLEESVGRVAELRSLAPHAILEVDGGVNQTNAPSLVAVGANNLVAGSSLFAAGDAQDNYDHLAAGATGTLTT